MSAPGAHRGGPRAGLKLRAPRLLPWLVVVVLIGCAASPAAADAEVFPEYPRPAREEPPAKWPQPEPQAAESEDAVVERLLGGAKGRDLAKERLHMAQLKQQQEQQEALQRQQQQRLDQKHAEEALLQRQREQHQKAELQKQQQNMMLQQLKLNRPQPKQQPPPPQPPKQAQEEQAMEQLWQETVDAALAMQAELEEQQLQIQLKQQLEKQQQEKQQQQNALANQQQKPKQQTPAVKQQQEEDQTKLELDQLAKEALAKKPSAKQQEPKHAQQAQQAQQGVPQDEALAGRLNDLTRALEQQPKVPDLDKALYRVFLQPAATGTEQEWQNYRSLGQPEDSVFSEIIQADVLRQERERQERERQQQDLIRSASLQEMERHAQRQAQSQDRQTQEMMRQQHDQVDEETARMFEQAMGQAIGQAMGQAMEQQAQPAFTYSFSHPSQSSDFAISPADKGFYQPMPPAGEDVRLQFLARHASQSSQSSQSSQPQEDQYDESAAGPAGRMVDLALSAEQRLLADPAAQDDVLEDEGMDMDAEDMAIAEQTLLREIQERDRVTQPVQPDRPRHQAKHAKDGKLDDDRATNLSAQDFPVVKKQLTFPKDHWFFGMDDVGKLAIFIGCSIAVSSMILGFVVWQYRLHRNAKAAADVEYPAYGVTGPNKDISPTGDRRLAQSAQMYHYQHQKQQILAMESRAAGGRRGSMSEAESEDENEEGDYTVYECPGLAPTQEMEVKNPLFQDDPTPATPAPGMGAEAGHDGDGLPEGGHGHAGSGQRKGSAASKKSSADGDRPSDDAATAKPNNGSKASTGSRSGKGGKP
ncbi:mediator of RNA polymerase II transcription subunit 15 [Thrips palmi]|uniref:Mediator of RNA polymerase II transcription subunit 15 n=1 Tax=Thrips palmi TaxID=161013 RepID=A0A6P8Y8I2_THRPL|nr:mediator of RNA polymerase II transcription subunit 15 [Thrips palmi]